MMRALPGPRRVVEEEALRIAMLQLVVLLDLLAILEIARGWKVEARNETKKKRRTEK
jgi:hypothetical protein